MVVEYLTLAAIKDIREIGGVHIKEISNILMDTAKCT